MKKSEIIYENSQGDPSLTLRGDVVTYFEGQRFVTGIVGTVLPGSIKIVPWVEEGTMLREGTTVVLKDVVQIQRPAGTALETSNAVLEAADKYEEKHTKKVKVASASPKASKTPKAPKTRDARLPDVGKAITREWKGSLVSAVEQDDGTFLVTKGVTDVGIFKSLSAAASAVPGTVQNGFRWFGLTGK